MAGSYWGSSEVTSSSRPDRVLLLNAPPYDTRLPWSKWQQPSVLLRLSTLLRGYGSDVVLVDALSIPADSKRLPRTRVDILDVDGINVSKWRFGLKRADFLAQLTSLRKRDWFPDVIYVECGTTYWWEGAAESIAAAKDTFPNAHVVLVGNYAEVARDHAMQNSQADAVPSEGWPELVSYSADLSVYTRLPTNHLITLGGGRRTADEVVDEIEAANRLNVRDFAIADHRPLSNMADLYTDVLDRVATKNLKVRLYALGSIDAAEIVAKPELAKLMRKAGYVQICFADDRETSFDAARHEQAVENYWRAAEICHVAGFKARTEELVASVCVGQQGEDLSERARFITLASHYIGSVIVWPYQPSIEECGDTPLEDQNGKIFPLRDDETHSYRDYLNLLGLATVFNSKHRSCTFDFLGDSFTARLFQESIARRGWSPNDDVKGSLKLPMVAR